MSIDAQRFVDTADGLICAAVLSPQRRRKYILSHSAIGTNPMRDSHSRKGKSLTIPSSLRSGSTFFSSQLLLIGLLLTGLVLGLARPAHADSAGLSADASFDIPYFTPPSLPPLPFREPQVGPVIKRGLPNEVDKWTTAFVPQGDMLMPDFEMPDEERWIRIDLANQMLIAYEDGRPIRAFIISSGLPRTPTVTGEFRIRMKVRSQTMSGGDSALGNAYHLPNVQWVQYFHQDYGLHGTYWHNNFGNPMSHGCVNMTNSDARWLFDWAGPEWDSESSAVWQRSTPENQGTLVIVHK